VIIEDEHADLPGRSCRFIRPSFMHMQRTPPKSSRSNPARLRGGSREGPDPIVAQQGRCWKGPKSTGVMQSAAGVTASAAALPRP
jgi:hypothetical protein